MVLSETRRLANFLNQFKKIVMSVSIDGYGELSSNTSGKGET